MPSTADITEIGGVIMPSARRAAPPIMAGITTHFLYLRTRAKMAKMPPSPLLSAFRVRKTYLKVVCRVSVQMMQLRAPMMMVGLMAWPLQMALNTVERAGADVAKYDAQGNEHAAEGGFVSL